MELNAKSIFDKFYIHSNFTCIRESKSVTGISFANDECTTLCYDLENSIRSLQLIPNWDTRYKEESFFSQYVNNALPFRFSVGFLSSDGVFIPGVVDKGRITPFDGMLSVPRMQTSTDLLELFFLSVSKKYAEQKHITGVCEDIGVLLMRNSSISITSVFMLHLDIDYETWKRRILGDNRDTLDYLHITNKTVENEKRNSMLLDSIAQLYVKSKHAIGATMLCSDTGEILHDIFMNSNIFSWGIIGNAYIEQYSVAPIMWRHLFQKLRLPIQYEIIGTDNCDELNDRFENQRNQIGMLGYNIAMPWKKWAFEKSEYYSLDLQIYETINTLCNQESKWLGYNTDGIGLVRAIVKNVDLIGKSVLLLGAGGSAQTVPKSLHKYGVDTIYIYDKDECATIELINKARKDCKKLKIYSTCPEHFGEILPIIDLVVNATSCGMLGHEDESILLDVHYDLVNRHVVFAETVYNPCKTKMLQIAESKGYPTIPGYHMLVEQAAQSFEYAFGFTLSNTDIQALKDIVSFSLHK